MPGRRHVVVSFLLVRVMAVCKMGLVGIVHGVLLNIFPIVSGEISLISRNASPLHAFQLPNLPMGRNIGGLSDLCP